MNIFKTKDINMALAGAKRIAIAGHIRPDGDCIGSCMAMYKYLMLKKDDYGIDIIDVYLEPISKSFGIIDGVDEINHTYNADVSYDVFISLDCASLDRLGNAIVYYRTAKMTINIDHHISNTEFAGVNHIVTNASSTCEVIFDLFYEDRITQAIAECVYVGIVHDTGVFKHSNTTGKTLITVARLLDKGIRASKLIDETYNQKTFMQNQLLGRCLMESQLALNGKVIISAVDREVLDFYHAQSHDTEGVIDQLRITKGVEVAIFIYEYEEDVHKISLRSNGDVNVSSVATYFDGGGHIKAAGCSMHGRVDDIVNRLVLMIEEQLKF